MNRIGIPYEDHMFDDISKNGAIINMNDINLSYIPGESQKKFAFIYLRNTGLNVEMDFTDCSYEDKDEFLILFLTGNISVKSSILASTWIEILASSDGGGIHLPCILNEEEIRRFIDEHIELINEFIRIVVSLPVYSLFVSPLNEKKYNMDDFQHNDFDQINVDNFSQLLEFDALSYIISANSQKEPLFYNRIFTKDNYLLINMMNHLPYFNILHGMFDMNEDMMNNLLDNINDFFNIPQMEVDE